MNMILDKLGDYNILVVNGLAYVPGNVSFKTLRRLVKEISDIDPLCCPIHKECISFFTNGMVASKALNISLGDSKSFDDNEYTYKVTRLSKHFYAIQVYNHLLLL